MYIYIYTNGKIAILISHRRLGAPLTLPTLLTWQAIGAIGAIGAVAAVAQVTVEAAVSHLLLWFGLSECGDFFPSDSSKTWRGSTHHLKWPLHLGHFRGGTTIACLFPQRRVDSISSVKFQTTVSFRLSQIKNILWQIVGQIKHVSTLISFCHHKALIKRTPLLADFLDLRPSGRLSSGTHCPLLADIGKL